MKRCSTALIMKKIQIKPTMRYGLTTVRMAIIKNSTWTENFQMFKLDLEKAEEPEIKLPTSAGSLKKQENSRKHVFC